MSGFGLARVRASGSEPDLRHRLVAIRKWRGMTCEQVAEIMCMTSQSVRQIETRGKPNLSTLERYAAAVGAEMGAWPAYPHTEPPEVKRPPRSEMARI